MGHIQATAKVKKIGIADWMAEGSKLFGTDPRDWRFVCPNCNHVQTIGDFIELRRAGIDIKDAQVATYSCIGRYDTRIPRTEIGTLGDRNKKQPCDYTLGGVFHFVRTIVVDGEGNEHPVFEFDRSSDSEGSEGEDGET